MLTYGFDERKNKIEMYPKSEATSKNETGNLSALRTSDKSSIVAAVNEVFQNANDGKNKLAAAIGSALTNSSTTPPKPSVSSTWDQMVSGILKMKIVTSEANDFTIQVKENRVQGSKQINGLNFAWDYKKFTHTLSKIQLPFSNVLMVFGAGVGTSMHYGLPIGPNISLRGGFGNWISASLDCTQTTQNGNKYIQLTVSTTQGKPLTYSPDSTVAEYKEMYKMAFLIIGY